MKPVIWTYGSIQRVLPRLRIDFLGNVGDKVPVVGLRRGYMSRTIPSKPSAQSYGITIMKRAASTTSKETTRAKKLRADVPEYHLTPSLRDESGEIIWPAPSAQIEGARKFILEWFVPTRLHIPLDVCL